MAKIDIISGFLGAGKTTLIKKLFKSSLKNEKVVLIENEFGEIGIDGSFLKESGVEIKEINSGCICCSLVGDFASSMKEVIDTYHPDRIIVEPSGVGKLSDIINAVKNVEEDLELNILCTVVDGKKAKMQIRNFGEFLKDQIGFAKTIVVTKVDLIDETKLQENVNIIKEVNNFANVITTKIDEINEDELLRLLENSDSLEEDLLKEVEEHHHHHEHCCHHHEHHHHHDENCECGCHEHHHDEECHHHEHHEHHHDENCECGCHKHHHEHHHHDEECTCGCHHEHHHHADEVFTSWGMETVYSITRNQLEQFLEFLKEDESLGMILRSKGILKGKDTSSWYYFDYVAGDYSISEGNPSFTGRIVVIGSKIDEHRIQEKFMEIVK